ncbi:biotin-dependent carboxyltransferase family protein [Winogradskyella eckloniae]|uniref:5-oxoprolinase subunit C family protein n=1 Tax=Winogradskyella eckloniae TaxID=1089306 RepID=UPI0015659704|nr:biotin-dependent carboxyltransferase family protein [Winogradskyella eckloniae]NRD19925.1 biotin-dependent carboxyltransferase family protein [Winogradskyella eckloniae]
MIKVLKSGFFTTIQDQGRFGYGSFGVPVSGAMDTCASTFANHILGNSMDAAVIEMTMIGAQFQFLSATLIAITGGHMNPKINNKTVPMNEVILVNKNDVLSLGNSVEGFRTYVAVKGGIITKMVLGSRSMLKEVTPSHRINKSDHLPILEQEGIKRIKNAKVKFNSSYLNTNNIEVAKGPEFDRLSEKQKTLLLNESFKVSKYNNRMAYQLLPVVTNTLDAILTAPVLPGTVQLTPSGQLIVLMRDCQTTGGYPRVLQLTEKAINILSQKSTGNNINFTLVDY